MFSAHAAEEVEFVCEVVRDLILKLFLFVEIARLYWGYVLEH